jgi:hypothetical protein
MLRAFSSHFDFLVSIKPRSPNSSIPFCTLFAGISLRRLKTLLSAFQMGYSNETEDLQSDHRGSNECLILRRLGTDHCEGRPSAHLSSRIVLNAGRILHASLRSIRADLDRPDGRACKSRCSASDQLWQAFSPAKLRCNRCKPELVKRTATSRT